MEADWDPQQAQTVILGGAAVIGGIAVGWAASQGWAEEVELQHPPPVPQQVGTWIAFNVGLVLLGAALKDAVEEYGVKTVAGVGLGVPAVALVIRAIRG